MHVISGLGLRSGREREGIPETWFKRSLVTFDASGAGLGSGASNSTGADASDSPSSPGSGLLRGLGELRLLETTLGLSAGCETRMRETIALPQLEEAMCASRQCS